MGYYTYYTMTIKKTDNITPATMEEANAVMDWLKANNEYVYKMFAEYGASDYMESYDSFKWYENEVDMDELSKQFPDLIFTLFGNGEAEDDFWYEDFWNGKRKLRVGQIVYPSFEETPWSE